MGILDDIDNHYVYEYKPITLEDIQKIMDSIKLAINVTPKTHRFYVDELTYIMFNLSQFEHKHKNRIQSLYSYLKYYNHIMDLYSIKAHHIIVGYSSMSLNECNSKRRYFMKCKEDIITNIKELYYGK